MSECVSKFGIGHLRDHVHDAVIIWPQVLSHPYSKHSRQPVALETLGNYIKAPNWTRYICKMARGGKGSFKAVDYKGFQIFSFLVLIYLIKDSWRRLAFPTVPFTIVLEFHTRTRLSPTWALTLVHCPGVQKPPQQIGLVEVESLELKPCCQLGPAAYWLDYFFKI